MYSSQTSVDSRFSTVQSTTGRQHVFKRRQTIATLSAVAAPPAAESVTSDKSPTCSQQTTLGGGATDDARRPRGSLRHRMRSPTAVTTQDSDVPCVTTSTSNWNQRAAGRRLQNRLNMESTPLPSLGQSQQQHRKLGRTPSSPSVLFSRVKERIREKVFETSAEWPHMAAIERERRLRAAHAFEQSLRSSLSMRGARQGQTQRQGHPQVARQSSCVNAVDDSNNTATSVPVTAEKITNERRRVRIKSDPSRRAVVSDSTDNKDDEGDVQQPPTTSMLARLAFRRRSISEDTYILETKMVAAAAAAADSSSSSCRFLGPSDYSSAESSTKNRRQGDGVVCSNEDLKAIVTQHKLRRSPAVSPTTAQPTSLDSQSATVQLSISDDVIVHVTSSSSNTETSSRTMFDQTSELLDSTTHDRHTSDFVACNMQAVFISVVDECVPHARDSSEAIELLPVVVADVGTKKKACAVREVVYDEHGQTWDVYGADFDPEILGQAIQAYLEKIMNKKLQKIGTQAARDSGGSGITSDSEVQGSRESHLCEPTSGRQGQRQIDRAIGFVMRYLCSSVWRQHHQVTSTKS